MRELCIALRYDDENKEYAKEILREAKRAARELIALAELGNQNPSRKPQIALIEGDPMTGETKSSIAEDAE